MPTETEILSQILSNNLGQRLTPELATGMLAVFAEQRAHLQAVAAKPTRKKKEPVHANAG